MMKRKSHKDPTPKLAFAISFCFHTLLLLVAYCLPIKQWGGFSSGYSIALHSTWSQQETDSEGIADHPPPSHQLASEQFFDVEDKKAAKSIQTDDNKEKILEDAAPEPQDTSDKDTPMKQIENVAQNPPEASTAANQEEETRRAIDERSLYKVHQDKQTGTLLELSGWIWDTVPQPQDDSDESGKIIFQITIDEFGEVIAVKTLEKTISPLVEKIYKEALTRLTFSKTADNLVYSSTSTGKVTFILQVK